MPAPKCLRGGTLRIPRLTGASSLRARAFQGTVQRLFEHRSYNGYEYAAGELSFGAPRGLSGGPLFTLPHIHLAGVVAEQIESTTELQVVDEYMEDGVLVREQTKKVVQYGVFVELAPLSRWLDREVGGELG